MRLMILAACGALLGACAESASSDASETDKVQEAKASLQPSADASAENLTVREANDASPANISACLIQDGEELRITPVRAIGTEPFWRAQVEGRCVTYSTPEDQKGTRIWTRFNPGPDGGVWIGTLDGKPFKLITRLRQGCSDGMSDRSYPLDALLTVRGEERNGCAEPVDAGKR